VYGCRLFVQVETHPLEIVNTTAFIDTYRDTGSGESESCPIRTEARKTSFTAMNALVTAGNPVNPVTNLRMCRTTRCRV
jgi:hypothetical protein